MVQYSMLHYPIFKSDVLDLNLQVPFTLPSVFSKTDSVSLKEDTFSIKKKLRPPPVFAGIDIKRGSADS